MKIKNLFYAMACSALMLTACSDDDDPKGGILNVDDVPENVLNAFESQYGQVKDVRWEGVQNYYVARFNGGIKTRANDAQYSCSAWYTPQGDYCQSDEDIDASQLPRAVKDGYAAYASKMGYTDWRVDEWEMVSRRDMGLIYVVEIEKGNQEREISFSEQGDMLKDVLDVDDDNDDILPVNIPEGLKQAVGNDFPGATIVEVEREDGMYEVDLIVNGVHEEAKYNNAFVLQNIEYELTYNELIAELSQSTIDQLTAILKKEGINIQSPYTEFECEVNKNPKTGFKAYEIEVEQGNKELEIYIDAKGKVTYRVEYDD